MWLKKHRLKRQRDEAAVAVERLKRTTQRPGDLPRHQKAAIGHDGVDRDWAIAGSQTWGFQALATLPDDTGRQLQ